MTEIHREYTRKCKQAGCNEHFVVSGPSLDQDRMMSYSPPEYCPIHRARHARSYSRIAMHHPDAAESAWGRERLKDSNPDLGPGGVGRLDRPNRPFKPKQEDPPTPNFPIAEKDSEILASLDANQVLVLIGPTGSGKSTHVPQMLLRSSWSRRGAIVVTQPRIQATRQIPEFVAKLNGSSFGPGAEIGYCHSGNDNYDRRTRLLFMTDGKLINDIVSGAVGNYSVVMIDEAHERSVNIDLILGLMREQLMIYPHLRLIIASATINPKNFIDFYGGKKKVDCVRSEGRFFPVEQHWWGEGDWSKGVNGGQPPERNDLPAAIADTVQRLWDAPDGSGGHILAFLPGTREIDATVDRIRALGLPGSLVLPLYANRPMDEQQRALNPKSTSDRKLRRVVVSTNVAETSLTVEGVRHVIDSGYIKETVYNPIGRVSEMRTQRHSQAGCEQRWGRAGRMEPGNAWLLYTREQFTNLFPSYTAPGIAQASMEEVVLTAAASGLRDLRAFPWVPMEDDDDNRRFHEELARSISSLQHRRLLDENCDLSRLGLELRGLAGGADQAMAFSLGDRCAMGVEVATLMPFLTLERGVQALLPREDELLTEEEEGKRERAWSMREKRLALFAGCEDDLDLFARLWMGWCRTSGEAREEWCAQHGIDAKAFRDKIEKERDRLLGRMADRHKNEKRELAVERLDALRALLCCSLPHAVYRGQSGEGAAASEPGEMDDGFALSDVPGPEDCGIFRRLYPRQDETEAETLVEIIPSSMAAAQPPELCLIMRRAANFLRPPRAAVLGINIIRIDPAWLPAMESKAEDSVVEQAMLFAQLSRKREEAEHQRNRKRLLLPLLLPVGAEICGVRPSTEQGRVEVEVHDPLWEGVLTLGFEGEPQKADEEGFPARVLRYEGAEPVLGPVAPAPHVKKLSSGRNVDLQLRRILSDPLGRMPFFEVQEKSSGARHAMMPEDFSGNAPCHPEHGLRFRLGDSFTANVVSSEPLIFSRAEALLNETLSVNPDWHRKVHPLRVQRVDEWGAWVMVGSYMALVKRGAWPMETPVQNGSILKGRILSRLRPAERKQIEEARAKHEPVPGGFALGYDVDLRVPETFERFRQHYQPGSPVEAMVARALDHGLGLMAAGQWINVPDGELDLDSDGNLRKPRSYQPGSTVNAVILRMYEDSAYVLASICAASATADLPERGEEIKVRVLLAGSEGRPSAGVTPDGVRVLLGEEGLDAGDVVDARVTIVYPDKVRAEVL